MIGCREVGVLFRNCEVSGRPTTKCGYVGRSQPPSVKEIHSHPSKTKYVFTVFGLIEVEFLAEESVSTTH